MSLGLGPEEVANLFAFHPATDVTGPLHDEVRATCHVAAQKLLALCPASAERTTAVRKLQEAMMHANAAIACHADRQGSPASG